MEKLIFSFEEAATKDDSLLGGKGANLAQMKKMNLPVPAGFIISTTACLRYLKEGPAIWDHLESQLKAMVLNLEQEMGKKLGSEQDPLLVSVRSGAAVSMPGMMDTILNLGLNDQSVLALAANTDNGPFAKDCYRRLIQMFGEVVLKIPPYFFNQKLEKIKNQQGVTIDSELNQTSLDALIKAYQEIVAINAGITFPQDPFLQLKMAIEAVFASWDNRRAHIYRRAHNISDSLGTAVTIQSMVFGNRGNQSGTGVLFTRNPSTGAKELYGEFLVNAQGEDVVAGIRTPLPLKKMPEKFPRIYQELQELAVKLEQNYLDAQDVEFTIEQERLFVLQTRKAKRNSIAAVNIAHDFVNEGLITKKQALLQIDPNAFETIFHAQLDQNQVYQVLAKGLEASPGAATGQAVFDADQAEQLGKQGEKVILITTETTPDDINGLLMSKGVLTARGGMTSHAAVVARGMGKPAVCGCEAVKIDGGGEFCYIGTCQIKAGDKITINGSTGEVILGEVLMKEAEMTAQIREILKWCDEERSLGIRANADNKGDATLALNFGAEGIGLCRTEHMFMGKDRLQKVQKLILGESIKEREEALKSLLPLQQADFVEILEVMAGRPVTIRLLDPPLHEFLPDLLDLQKEIYKLEQQGLFKELSEQKEVFRKTKNMTEANPMLGLRGCRLGIIMPPLYQMQVRALLKAAVELANQGIKSDLEIMIPLISTGAELDFLQPYLEQVIAQELTNPDQTLINYKIGTMIELPRACLTADEIAAKAEFFSFGTNDLTQTTYGFSRDDAEAKFLHSYLEHGILEQNPFVSIDQGGVGKLIKMGIELGRRENPNLKIGICGEHGGDPQSISFCHHSQLDYVSCSPFRVPVARLAAAQVAITAAAKDKN